LEVAAVYKIKSGMHGLFQYLLEGDSMEEFCGRGMIDK
jgi:hypothetical protein